MEQIQFSLIKKKKKIGRPEHLLIRRVYFLRVIKLSTNDKLQCMMASIIKSGTNRIKGKGKKVVLSNK